MDEMTFRSKLLTHPHILDDEMLAYLEENPEQKAVVQSVREFDKQISETFDVEIPEGLHARILLRQSYDEGSQQGDRQDDIERSIRHHDELSTNTETAAKSSVADSKVVSLFKRSSWLYGLAASILVVAVGVNQFFSHSHHDFGHGTEGFIDHVLAHIEEDAYALTTIRMPDSKEEMNELFATVGAQLNQSVEGMTYAGMCDVHGEEGLHIVMQQNNKPVTLIVMAGEHVDTMQAFERSGYKGQLVPVKGGVVAIVADTMEQVALASARFFKAVRFT